MSADWDDLRVFLTLAREGSLTMAARSLGVSHPTVARRVRALEQRIGARLFDRLPDRFVPTSAGEELLGAATSRVLRAQVRSTAAAPDLPTPHAASSGCRPARQWRP